MQSYIKSYIKKLYKSYIKLSHKKNVKKVTILFSKLTQKIENIMLLKSFFVSS